MQKRGIKTERKVMVAGHLCLDITPKFPANERFCIEDVFSPGRLTNVEEATLSTGGAEPGIWASREMWAGSFKTEEFGSTLGSGDATIAGFLCAFLRGYSPEDTLQIANMVGWQNVRAVDALSGIGSWQSTVELLREKTRPRNPVGLGADGWRYSKSRQVYYGPNDKLILEGKLNELQFEHRLD